VPWPTTTHMTPSAKKEGVTARLPGQARLSSFPQAFFHSLGRDVSFAARFRNVLVIPRVSASVNKMSRTFPPFGMLTQQC
jgi:hypothetical protein